MRIQNLKAVPLYVDEAAVTLNPGGTTAELPLSAIHGKTLKRLLAGGHVKIILSDADRDFLDAVILSHESEAKPKAPPAPPKTPAQYRREAQVAKAKAKAALPNARRLPVPAVNPRCIGGQPDLGSMPIPTIVSDKPLSVAEMLSHNKALQAQKKAALADAQTILKSRV